MFPLIVTLLFPFGGIPLDLNELDTYPDNETLRVWMDCNNRILMQSDPGPVADECMRLWQGMRYLRWARTARDRGGDRGEALLCYGMVFKYCPEWRFAPSRVLMLPYKLMKKK